MRSANEGEPGQPPELEGFDWRFYLGYYPDLKKQGINNRRRATRHWLQFGHPEGRVGGRHHKVYRENWENLTRYLESVPQRADQARVALSTGPFPLINILTRSNRRPRFFEDNRKSVVGQSYPRIRQWVSYENQATLEYLTALGLPGSDLVRVSSERSAGTHPYNLFINELMERVEQGWILFLDDDDLLTTPEALTVIASRLVDEESLVIWRAWFPDKIVPAITDAALIEPGGITSCCFAFHSRHRARAQWHEFKAGDYRCFDQLRRFLKPVFLDDILARVNYTDAGAGWGIARDKRS